MRPPSERLSRNEFDHPWAKLRVAKVQLLPLTTSAKWLNLSTQCLLCLQALRETSADHLCAYCRLALPLNRHACHFCAIPMAESVTPQEKTTLNAQKSDNLQPRRTLTCGQCLSNPMVDRAVVPLLHQSSAAHLVHRLKFGKGEPEGMSLAQIMLLQIRQIPPVALPDLLIPVPTSYWTGVRRGFNQSSALAGHLAVALDLKVVDYLLRRRHGPAQRTLTRAARQRLSIGNFPWRKPSMWRISQKQRPSPVEGMHVAIIDDVLTTGATVREITRQLRRHGATRVEAWCATRTQAPF